jgi:hypothetical protein
LVAHRIVVLGKRRPRRALSHLGADAALTGSSRGRDPFIARVNKV